MSPDPQEIPDEKLRRGFYRLNELKLKKKKGRVTFYTDGTGKVNEIEVVEKE